MASSPWLNPKLVVAASPIAGLGLRAVVEIAECEVCCRLGGTLMNDDEFASYIAGRDRYSALAIDEGLNLVQSDNDDTTKGNHSCDPNLWLRDARMVVARVGIAAGDEATIDYALMTVDPNWSMECNCGATRCRGRITGDDWRSPELQPIYREHWSPFIERRIADLNVEVIDQTERATRMKPSD